MPPDVSHSRKKEDNPLQTPITMSKGDDDPTSTSHPAHQEEYIPFKRDVYQVISYGPLTFLDHGFFKWNWTRITWFGVHQLMHLISLGCIITGSLSWTNVKTWMFSWILYLWAGFGITAGAHRLWAHRSYSARWPLRVILMIGHVIAGQRDLFWWCRDHRVHHKYSDTDPDPHNSKRGFFYSHVGWLLTQPHYLFLRGCNTMYVMDLLHDPILRFQVKFYRELFMIFFLLMPIMSPIILWDESLFMSILFTICFRYVTTCHSTWFVNSAAHMFGHRPYNPKIPPTENHAVSFGSLGEGYHNFHHTFPYDYAQVEFSAWGINATKGLIDLMSILGLSYDRKRAPISKKQMKDAQKEKETPTTC